MNHRGLNLQGDLTEASAWNGPVLEVKIERVGPGPFVAASMPPSVPRPPVLQFTPPGSGFITSASMSADYDQ